MTQHNRETLLADSGGAHPTDRAGGLRPEPVSPSQPEALIPCADYAMLSDGAWTEEFTAAILKCITPSASYARWKKLTPFTRRGRKNAYISGLEVGIGAALRIVEETSAFAQGTEARRAATAQTGAVHDGPVPTGCATLDPTGEKA